MTPDERRSIAWRDATRGAVALWAGGMVVGVAAAAAVFLPRDPPPAPCPLACPSGAIMVVAAGDEYPSGFTTLILSDGGWTSQRRPAPTPAAARDGGAL